MDEYESCDYCGGNVYPDFDHIVTDEYGNLYHFDCWRAAAETDKDY